MTADPGIRDSDGLPDTALATGNDDGLPGDRLGDGTLDPDERALLDHLRHGGGGRVVTTAAEDSRAMEDAVENDSIVLGED
jgi:hypothetical protein